MLPLQGIWDTPLPSARAPALSRTDPRTAVRKPLSVRPPSLLRLSRLCLFHSASEEGKSTIPDRGKSFQLVHAIFPRTERKPCNTVNKPRQSCFQRTRSPLCIKRRIAIRIGRQMDERGLTCPCPLNGCRAGQVVPLVACKKGMDLHIAWSPSMRGKNIRPATPGSSRENIRSPES